MFRHVQVGVGPRLALWAGLDTRTWALPVCPFLGYRCDDESHSLRVALSLGPLYIGAGFRFSWCRHEQKPAGSV